MEMSTESDRVETDFLGRSDETESLVDDLRDLDVLEKRENEGNAL